MSTLSRTGQEPNPTESDPDGPGPGPDRTRTRTGRHRTGPELVLWAFDGIAGRRRPSAHTYAAPTKDAPARRRSPSTEEDRDVRR